MIFLPTSHAIEWSRKSVLNCLRQWATDRRYAYKFLEYTSKKEYTLFWSLFVELVGLQTQWLCLNNHLQILSKKPILGGHYGVAISALYDLLSGFVCSVYVSQWKVTCFLLSHWLFGLTGSRGEGMSRITTTEMWSAGRKPPAPGLTATEFGWTTLLRHNQDLEFRIPAVGSGFSFTFEWSHACSHLELSKSGVSQPIFNHWDFGNSP